MSTSTALTKKFSSLQVYRGLAAVFVVLFHVTNVAREKANISFLGNFFGFGFTGVDFFFVLSGFIIFYTSWSDFGKKENTFFYLARRLARIFPIYWIITGAKLLVILIQPSVAKAYETEASVILKSVFLIPQEDFPIIGAAWTLSYELLFYILVVIFIAVNFRFGTKVFIGWAVAILSYNISKVFLGNALPRVFLVEFLFNERNLEFLLGCLSAYLFIHYSQRIKFPLLWIALGILLFAFSSWFTIQGGNIFSYAFFFGLPSFLLVLGSSVLESRKGNPWPQPLVFVGDASYSIYLAHAIFVNFFLIIVNRLGLFEMAGATTVSILLAVSSVIGGCFVFFLLERPIMKTLSKKIKALQNRSAAQHEIPAAEKPQVL